MKDVPPEPDLPADVDIAALLDQAEDVVNEVGAQVLEEERKRKEKQNKKGLFRRRKKN